MSTSPILWQPDAEAVSSTNLARFITYCAEKHDGITDYDSLYRWSTDGSGEFWARLWEFCGVVSHRQWDQVLENPDAMPGANWFTGARLNFAENLLRYRDDRTAIIATAEGKDTVRMSYAELYSEVARCAALLRQFDVKEGDRVVGYMANCPETIVAMLATASIGAVWSSCSPDFGIKGVVERFSQIEPVVMFGIDGYQYNGKNFENLSDIAAITQEITSIREIVILGFHDPVPDISSVPRAISYRQALDQFDQQELELEFASLPFDHPLYILYSSGTTGKPKCIVHGAGGTLLQHLKEHQLHTDITRDDVLFYYSTCGWMMWNWLASSLASGCTMVLYDGSPFYPNKHAMWDMVDELGITVFGTSARYIAACAKSRVTPRERCDLGSLRAILSTGSPLVAEGFDYVYKDIKSDLMLSSISGGTDIVSCFVLGNPMRPVRRGEIQCRGLGLAVDVFDDGKPVREKRAELVCTRPFPCMPLGFWGEPDDSRYIDAYFSRFPGVWAQGDYAEITASDGVVIYGRSDAVLNPGGVRIGTAEIYRQVEKVDEVLESLCIAQQWEDDVRIVLFVMLRDGVKLDQDLVRHIKDTIKSNTTPRHVPRKVIAVPDIPRTLSGKIVELAVRNVVHGDPVKNTEAMANPEALEYFRNVPELQEK